MYRLGKYSAGDGMSDLVCENYRTLPVLSRFGIGLGFGDRTIGEVCAENAVDTATLLAVVNMLAEGDCTPDTVRSVSVASLLGYLHKSHEYFLDFRLPAIRSQLAEVIRQDGRGDIGAAILGYFDEYVAEVRRHMAYEEDKVFPYVRSLLGGCRQEEYNIGIFRKHHSQVEARLTEFKNIIIKYFPAKSTNEINGVLFDIFNCEQDLASHNDVEDRLFVPAVMLLETQNSRRR